MTVIAIPAMATMTNMMIKTALESPDVDGVVGRRVVNETSEALVVVALNSGGIGDEKLAALHLSP
jgi:hypothetical protein